jgi:tRNA threonylcarbamoyladenosine biosynthesis protein TsaE
MKIHKTTKTFYETQSVGKELAKELLKRKIKDKKAIILALNGDLGSGKTTFLQGFAQGLGIEEKILSPTFVIFKKFKIKNPDFYLFYHIDCYRLQNSQDLLSLGFKDFAMNPKNIIAIEWAEKVEDILPDDVINVNFKVKGKDNREIKIQ